MAKPTRLVGASRFTVIRSKNGGINWQVKDEYGKAVKSPIGHIYGLDPNDTDNKAAYDRSTRIIERMLKAGKIGGSSMAGAPSTRAEAKIPAVSRKGRWHAQTSGDAD